MASKLKLIFNPITGALEYASVSSVISATVEFFADLPTASVSNAGLIYVVEKDSGSIFLFNKREAGLYRSNGTIWEAFTDVSAQSIEVDDTNIGSGSSNLQLVLEYLGSNTPVTWINLATRWDTAPVLNKAITGGDVYTYTYNSVQIFRFVSTVYDSTQDCFYENFNPATDVLSDPIVCRGI